MNILFDLDGTLTDSKLGITNCIKFALENLNQQIPQDLDWCIGPPLEYSFSKLLDDESKVTKAIELYRERFSKTGIYENKMYEGVDTVLSELESAGHKLFLATSKPIQYAKIIIKHFNLSHFFISEYGSEFDGTRKDKTDLIKYILEQENLNPKETYMIGDRKYDLIGAKNNKVSTLGVLYGYGSKSELAAEKPNGLVSLPAEITTFFNRM